MNAIERSKTEYLQVIHEYAKHHKIVIYGAGINGHRLFKLLMKEHITIDSFAVTSATLNVKDIKGVQVKNISWWDGQYDEEYVFLIGVAGTNGAKIHNELEKRHIRNIVDAPEYFEIFILLSFQLSIMIL